MEDRTSREMGSRLDSRLTTSKTSRQDTRHSSSSFSTCGSTAFVCGERINKSAVASLSSLYQSNYTRFPTFPSIYETKYQHDFRYIHFPVPKTFKTKPEKANYENFQFGRSRYEEEYRLKSQQNIQRTKLAIPPCLIGRKHNPQPSIQIIQQYPNQARCLWSKLEGSHVSKNKLANANPQGPKYHRWYSR